ncbi:MAG: hypothetical protein J0M32_19145 [Candidatus Accumulibacter sp.]|nr:hypothetical protein [Accumulibacter sp.]MBO3716595.1 hypothetical protein [Accumulibacter sp.]
MSGFSPQNLCSMRQFFVICRDALILQQIVGEMPRDWIEQRLCSTRKGVAHASL